MSTQTVTIKLNDEVYRRFQSSANAMQKSVEDLLAQSIHGNLPPSSEDFPAEFQAEISGSLQNMSSQSLWEIAKGTVQTDTWARHQNLLEKNQDGILSTAEVAELDTYRREMDNTVMRRSYAIALLKWRGYSISAAGHSI